MPPGHGTFNPMEARARYAELEKKAKEQENKAPETQLEALIMILDCLREIKGMVENLDR